jgi:glycosyltransferase involved in cell wall biosynthesis
MTDRRLTLVASNVAPVGGMERAAHELASRLLARGWRVTVIARSCGLAPQAGLRFRRIVAPPRPVSLAVLLSYVQGTLLVWRSRDGLVQLVNPVAANAVDVATVQFCETAYRRRVGSPRRRRSGVLYQLNEAVTSLADRRAERWSYRPGRTRRLVAVSHGVARELAEDLGAPAGMVRTIPNGVDRAAFAPDAGARRRVRDSLGLGDDVPVALFVGGDWHRKGLRLAVEGVAAAAGWHLLVVGHGDEASFGALAATLGAADRVHFAGRRPDPAPWYAAADVLVFPSAYEGFSLVTLEAASSGLVLLVRRINGTEELVEEGRNGWFVEPHGASIAQRLRQLAAEPERLAAMREAAREATVPYDWDRVADAYEALYAELGGAATA